MDDFEAITLRLKQALGVTMDKQVADALGLSPRAWAGRKKTGHFPEKDLLVLVARRADLQIDVGYVLTGVHQPRHARMRADAMAKVAGEIGGERLTAVATEMIRTDSERNRQRKETFDLLTDLAEHCDDEHLRLLVDVAEAFRKSTIQSPQVAAARAATDVAAGPRTVVEIQGDVGQHVRVQGNMDNQTFTMNTGRGKRRR